MLSVYRIRETFQAHIFRNRIDREMNPLPRRRRSDSQACISHVTSPCVHHEFTTKNMNFPLDHVEFHRTEGKKATLESRIIKQENRAPSKISIGRSDEPFPPRCIARLSPFWCSMRFCNIHTITRRSALVFLSSQLVKRVYRESALFTSELSLHLYPRGR